MTGLLKSLEDLRADKVVIDFGLTPDQLAALASSPNVKVVRFTYPYDFPAKRQAGAVMPGFGAMLARPYLNEFSKDYEVALWLDADVWVQDPQAIEMLVSEAARFGIAAVPEIDRSYFKFVGGQHVWNLEAQVTERIFGREIAGKMYLVPTFNVGVLAIRSDSPVWNTWRQYLQKGLLRISAIDGHTRCVEQIAFNFVTRLGNLAVRSFPATFNWLVCLGRPAWDAQRRLLVEPSPPYESLKLVHLSTHVLDRIGSLACVNSDKDEQVSTSLDFFSIKALRDREM
ncbi:MAG TPA: hypothetical protein VH684_20785 [Xanthobacteraceae bacterium]